MSRTTVSAWMSRSAVPPVVLFGDQDAGELAAQRLAGTSGVELPRGRGRVAGRDLQRDPLTFETSLPGVFADGDVRVGANCRVAAAVGEGSAVLHSVHRHLQTV